MNGPLQTSFTTATIFRGVRSALFNAAIIALAGGASFTVSEDVLAATTVSPEATVETPLRDPWVPPELRKAPTASATEGAALRAQVERKLKAAFDAADVSRTGTITRAQARSAGLGYIVRHFDAIDAEHSGGVRFDDVKRFLRANGAELN